MATDDQEPFETNEKTEPVGDGGISDTIKRALSTGVRTFLKSEENIRNLAGDIWNSDKVEAVGTVITNFREEIVTVFGREFVTYLDRMNLTDEAVKVLTAISLELKTEIRFIPNEERLVTPEVKASVKVKGRDKKKKEARKKRKPRVPRRRAKSSDDK